MNIINDYAILSKKILDTYIEKISCGESKKVYLNEVPKDTALIGMLSGQINENNGFYFEETKNQFKAVPSIGLHFILSDYSQGNIYLSLKGRFFYRTKPTYDEQINYIITKYKNTYPEITDKDQLINLINNNHEIGKTRDQFVDKYIKVDISEIIEPLLIVSKGDFIDEEKINTMIAGSIYKHIETIKNESFLIKKASLPIKDYVNPNTFNLILNSYASSSIINWSLQVRIKKDIDKSKTNVWIQYINNTSQLDRGLADYAHDTKVYDARMSVRGEELTFEDITLNLIKHDYLSPASVKGVAENCSVSYDKINNTLETTNIPLYIQKRLKTNDELNDVITFDKLINNPISNLEIILLKIKEAYNQCNIEYTQDKTNGKSKVYLKKEEDELDNFKSEIRKFENGIELIKRNKLVLDSFSLMNKTFNYKTYPSQSTYLGWKLFQIVFIVSQLCDIAYSEYKDKLDYVQNDIDMVDLLYFPTGGGKTEAFIGCVVFTLFFDRLRGKEKGISAMIKYPLRLLSIQQLDRIMTIITKANFVLQASGEYAPFSLGYYVGSQNTENIISNDLAKRMELLTQEEMDNKFRVLDICPYCGEMNVHTYFRKKDWILIHECQSCKKELPLFSIDDEIYRYLPSIVVGTVDKLAMIGTSPKFKLLFGEHTGYCSTHGFIALPHKLFQNRIET